ncbi:alpha/beta fold hydrolase [Vulgatibacter incomptus]|uniref:Alpha/beta hydrolase fold protein n=1 Tax=Vulgatibacter incomptus TaxID=1391653 RepID=A0A0K1PF87_9BACT|nr:alpha/beta fold hydrolase [Vulgatibacter incomptus]AKU92172.1 alpha/beta hydrolase fold protein [Vulgatibacter incomptus]
MPLARIEGRELHYEDTGGAGPALLLLHGYPLCAAMWRRQLEALGTRARVIAPDLPGFGASQSPADPLSWRIRDYADAAKGLLDSLGIERAVVGGLSMGGYVAFSLFRRHRGAVRALILADTRPGADSQEDIAARTSAQEEIRVRGTAALKERLLTNLLAPKNIGDPLFWSRALELMDHEDNGYLAALEAMKHRPDSTPDLGHIDVPTLIVVGAEDRLTSPAVSRAMQGAIPGARLAVIPGAGHLSNLEEPEAFNEALASFLDGL